MDPQSVLRSTPSESDGRIRFLGTFASPAVEKAFRQQRFRDERWLVCFLVMAGIVRVSLFLLADYQDFRTGPAFWALLACRLVFFAVSALFLVALRRVVSPSTADQLFLGWSFVLAALTICALSARPPSNSALLLLSFAMILVAYFMAPLPLIHQAVFALTFSAAGLYVAQRTDGITFSMVGLAYALSNLFGAITSWRFNHRRRERFLGALREAQLRAALEKAMAEIRTLRGLLCICAWCKRIRDEGEAWQSLEDFVESRTHAAFTHGICPDCLQSQVKAHPAGALAHA